MRSSDLARSRTWSPLAKDFGVGVEVIGGRLADSANTTSPSAVLEGRFPAGQESISRSQ